jgi:hypothetical protein
MPLPRWRCRSTSLWLCLFHVRRPDPSGRDEPSGLGGARLHSVMVRHGERRGSHHEPDTGQGEDIGRPELGRVGPATVGYALVRIREPDDGECGGVACKAEQCENYSSDHPPKRTCRLRLSVRGGCRRDAGQHLAVPVVQVHLGVLLMVIGALAGEGPGQEHGEQPEQGQPEA